jgi:hypothetical protein
MRTILFTLSTSESSKFFRVSAQASKPVKLHFASRGELMTEN